MRVVGLDLSLTGTGIAVLESARLPVLVTAKSKGVPAAAYSDTASFHAADLANRDSRIHRLALRILDEAGFASLVVLEGPSYASATGQMWDRAWLWGTVVHRLLLEGVPVAVAAPATVKKFAAGKGTASKVDVAAAMTRLWPKVTPANDNEFDALALATMGAQWLAMSAPSRAHHAATLDHVWWPELALIDGVPTAGVTR